jgi:hypothetical protein
MTKRYEAPAIYSAEAHATRQVRPTKKQLKKREMDRRWAEIFRRREEHLASLKKQATEK